MHKPFLFLSSNTCLLRRRDLTSRVLICLSSVNAFSRSNATAGISLDFRFSSYSVTELSARPGNCQPQPGNVYQNPSRCPVRTSLQQASLIPLAWLHHSQWVNLGEICEVPAMAILASKKFAVESMQLQQPQGHQISSVVVNPGTFSSCITCPHAYASEGACVIIEDMARLHQSCRTDRTAFSLGCMCAQSIDSDFSQTVFSDVGKHPH